MNDRVLEADDTGLIEADEWAALEPRPAPLDMSAELQRQVNEFLTQGGRIKEFKPGESALPDNRSLWGFPVGVNSTPDPVKRIQGEARRRAIASVRGDQPKDAALAAQMNLLLDSASTQKELGERMGVSPSVLYRLCDQYFADDKRADRFRKRTVEERAAIYDALMLPKIREALAAGVKGIYNIAQYCGASSKYISDVNTKHRLQIPKELPGRRVNREAAPGKAEPNKYEGRHSCLNTACDAKFSGNAFYCPGCGHITAKGQARGLEE